MPVIPGLWGRGSSIVASYRPRYRYKMKTLLMVMTTMCAWFLSTVPSKKKLKYHLVMQLGFVLGFGFYCCLFCFVFYLFCFRSRSLYTVLTDLELTMYQPGFEPTVLHHQAWLAIDIFNIIKFSRR